ncbi:hypothetical protein VAWG004_15190 [Aeromonas veronii]|nr:hypothetical protein VAWG004_15190 [Aeromonas veronii]
MEFSVKQMTLTGEMQLECQQQKYGGDKEYRNPTETERGAKPPSHYDLLRD